MDKEELAREQRLDLHEDMLNLISPIESFLRRAAVLTPSGPNVGRTTRLYLQDWAIDIMRALTDMAILDPVDYPQYVYRDQLEVNYDVIINLTHIIEEAEKMLKEVRENAKELEARP